MINYYIYGMQPMSVIFHILLVHVNGVQIAFHAEVSELRIKVLYKAWITSSILTQYSIAIMVTWKIWFQ